MTRTTNVEDLEWLDQLIPTAKGYKKRILADPGINFGMTWDIFERGKMYLKIDDDVVSTSGLPPWSWLSCHSGFSIRAILIKPGLHRKLDGFRAYRHETRSSRISPRLRQRH